MGKLHEWSILTYDGFDPAKTPMSFLIHLQAILLGVLVWAAGLLFVPSFVMDPYEYPKALFFIVATGLLTAVSLAHWFSVERSFSWRKVPIEVKLLFGVVAAECLAFLFSTDHFHSLLGAPYRFQGLIAQLTIAGYFLNVVYVFCHLPAVSRRLFFGSVVGAGVVSALLSLTPFVVEYSFFDLASFQNRIYGALGNPNYLAIYLAALIPFLGLFFTLKSKMMRALVIVAGVLLLAVLFMTGSRSAWVSLLLGLFGVSVLVAWKKRAFRMLALVLSVLALIAGVFFFQRLYETKLLHRLSLTKDNVGSVMTRVYLQEAGLKLFLQRPIFGTGQEMVMNHIEPYLPEYLKMNRVFYIDRTHNEFLDILVMQGLVGFLAYVLFWGVLLWRAVKYYLSANHFHSDLFSEQAFLFSLAALVAILSNYAMNFSVISANILLYLFAGYLVAVQYRNES